MTIPSIPLFEIKSGDRVRILFGIHKGEIAPVVETALPWAVILDMHGMPHQYRPDEVERVQ